MGAAHWNTYDQVRLRLVNRFFSSGRDPGAHAGVVHWYKLSTIATHHAAWRRDRHKHTKMKTAPDVLHIEHLHPEIEEPRTAKWKNMLTEMAQLTTALQQARQEIGYLTAERDELVHALRTWAAPEPVSADRI